MDTDFDAEPYEVPRGFKLQAIRNGLSLGVRKLFLVLLLLLVNQYGMRKVMQANFKACSNLLHCPDTTLQHSKNTHIRILRISRIS